MADLRGAQGTPPRGPNSFNFMQFLGKFIKFVCWRPPPGELMPPPRGNPGSATGMYQDCGGQSFEANLELGNNPLMKCCIWDCGSECSFGSSISFYGQR